MKVEINIFKTLRRTVSNFQISKLVILVIISQLAIVSCKSLVKEIDPSILPQTDSKLVVACFISPQDTLLEVSVTQTAPVIGTVLDGAERYPNTRLG